MADTARQSPGCTADQLCVVDHSCDSGIVPLDRPYGFVVFVSGEEHLKCFGTMRLLVALAVLGLAALLLLDHASAVSTDRRKKILSRKTITEATLYKSGTADTLTLKPSSMAGGMPDGSITTGGATTSVVAQLGAQGTKLDLLAKAGLAKAFNGYPLNRVVLVLQKPGGNPLVWLRFPANQQPNQQLAPDQFELAARSFLDQFDYWGNVFVRYAL